jgi:hypothetical protein
MIGIGWPQIVSLFGATDLSVDVNIFDIACVETLLLSMTFKLSLFDTTCIVILDNRIVGIGLFYDLLVIQGF